VQRKDGGKLWRALSPVSRQRLSKQNCCAMPSSSRRPWATASQALPVHQARFRREKQFKTHTLFFHWHGLCQCRNTIDRERNHSARGLRAIPQLRRLYNSGGRAPRRELDETHRCSAGALAVKGRKTSVLSTVYGERLIEAAKDFYGKAVLYRAAKWLRIDARVLFAFGHTH